MQTYKYVLCLLLIAAPRLGATEVDPLRLRLEFGTQIAALSREHGKRLTMNSWLPMRRNEYLFRIAELNSHERVIGRFRLQGERLQILLQSAEGDYEAVFRYTGSLSKPETLADFRLWNRDYSDPAMQLVAREVLSHLRYPIKSLNQGRWQISCHSSLSAISAGAPNR